jgi:REP element-mobilizing transposase RayT
MGRAPRVWEEGALYHGVPKGNDGRPIVVDDRDRRDLLVRIDAAAETYGATFLGYCLMDNHLHCLVISGADGLSEFFQVVLGGYSRGWNRRHDHEGHRFRNRVFAVEVKTEAHAWNAARYIDMNPVVADAVTRPDDWAWSSFRAHAGIEPPPRFLDIAEFLTYFGTRPQSARQSYLRFVDEWRPQGRPVHDDPARVARLIATASAEEDPDAPRARALLSLPPES